jgi:hypothetical protein
MAAVPAPAKLDRMSSDENKSRSLMESTGLGLLPGLVLATGLIVTVMASLLTGSLWAVAGVLLVIIVSAMAVVYVVVAVSTDGEDGRRMRAKVPGLGEPDSR